MSTATDGARTETTAVEAWVEAFAEGWRAPRDADSFADHFDPWLTDDVRLVQPQLPPIVGRRAFRESFARPIFSLIDDLRGTVERWAAKDEVVLIELTLTGRIGGRPFRLAVVDRVTLRDGRAAERVSYFDPTPLLVAVASRPSAWPKFLKIQASQLLGRRDNGGSSR
jgi:ketosteroid isomerase-like protein